MASDGDGDEAGQGGPAGRGGGDDGDDELDAFMAGLGADHIDVGRGGGDDGAPGLAPGPMDVGAPAPEREDSVGSLGIGLDGDDGDDAAQPAPAAAAPGFGGRAAPPPGAAPSAAPSGRGGHAEAPWEESEEEGGSTGSVDVKEARGEVIEDDAAWAEAVRWGRLSKGDKLAELAANKPKAFDPFRRSFYIEPPELAGLGKEEVSALRRKMDGIKVRGQDVPKPLSTWNQAGLSQRIQEALRQAGFGAPMPIQAQALPAIMSGRDCIGIAKTGSGKTLAYVLPLLRHAKDQPPLREGDGPIGLIVAPTRELVVQIGKECRRFAKVVGLTCVSVYGGSGVAQQIADLKRGADVVACTPGRMIDILVTGNGKITNMWRVTMLVIDEADRLFDLGFEPQIMRIIDQIRPDRQTVLFSATFPKAVEILARRMLSNPVEILVGGRSVVNKSITQFVEVREPSERLMRLLEILGEWYDKGKVLVFVQKQEACDMLFRELLQLGYPCLSLHGGKDQSDRGSTIADFKSGVCNILVATSLAARGLDIQDLVLVVNFDVPNHLEDYVHRVGRTGRAGKEGTAITFISATEEAAYAPDLVKALKDSGAPVPEDLLALSAQFRALVKAGQAKKHGSGFGGSGFKFDDREADEKKAQRDGMVKEYGMVETEGKKDGDESDGMEEFERATRVTKAEPKTALPPPPDAAGGPTAAAGALPGPPGTGQPAGAASPAPPAPVPRARRSRFDRGGPAGGEAATPPAGASTAIVPGGTPPAASSIVPSWKHQEVNRNKYLSGPASAEATRAAMQAAAVAAQLSGGGALAARLSATKHLESISSVYEAARERALAEKALREAGVKPAEAPRTEFSEFTEELEINDFVQHARYRATHREVLRDVTEASGCSVMVRGNYYKPGTPVPEDDRKLYLYIEGPSNEAVRKAKKMVKEIIEEATEKALKREARGGVGTSIV